MFRNCGDTVNKTRDCCRSSLFRKDMTQSSTLLRSSPDEMHASDKLCSRLVKARSHTPGRCNDTSDTLSYYRQSNLLDKDNYYPHSVIDHPDDWFQ